MMSEPDLLEQFDCVRIEPAGRKNVELRSQRGEVRDAGYASGRKEGVANRDGGRRWICKTCDGVHRMTEYSSRCGRVEDRGQGKDAAQRIRARARIERDQVLEIRKSAFYHPRRGDRAGHVRGLDDIRALIIHEKK